MNEIYSPKATQLLQELAEEKHPFQNETLWRYAKRPGAREFLRVTSERIALTVEAMQRICQLIREGRQPTLRLISP